MDETCTQKEDLAQIARLALAEQNEDVRLFVARLVRKYRDSDPVLAKQLDLFLKSKSAKARSPLRKSSKSKLPETDYVLPVDDESRLSLLKIYTDTSDCEAPLMSESLDETLSQLIQERRQTERLLSLGLQPTRSAIFVGAPGVGKTLTARWIAMQLELPLYILDLTAVMSSFLGRSGNNLRAALDFAKRVPCVLLLDEIDAIAKRRSDDADIGELKRLVTVIMQEVDEWEAGGLLLAATNHPELIDPALWRRFDLIVEFDLPNQESIKEAVKRFLDTDYAMFDTWADTLTLAFKGQSFSDIKRTTQRFRRALALSMSTDRELVEEFVKARVSDFDHKSKIEMATKLAAQSHLSQHAISNITGVSRDTIRKYSNAKKP